jgi:hypothetical protein
MDLKRFGILLADWPILRLAIVDWRFFKFSIAVGMNYCVSVSGRGSVGK